VLQLLAAAPLVQVLPFDQEYVGAGHGSLRCANPRHLSIRCAPIIQVLPSSGTRTQIMSLRCHTEKDAAAWPALYWQRRFRGLHGSFLLADTRARIAIAIFRATVPSQPPAYGNLTWGKSVPADGTRTAKSTSRPAVEEIPVPQRLL
jgi:hypothetical protein